MLRGFTTDNYWADDVEAARDWYSRVLEIEPYFQRPEDGPPAYVEFRVGPDQDELGLIDRRYSPSGAPRDPGGAVMHWHVDDVPAAVTLCTRCGATAAIGLERCSIASTSLRSPSSISKRLCRARLVSRSHAGGVRV